LAYTVDASFNQFYGAINLSGDHRATATQRKDHLIQILGNRFHVIDSLGTGSIPKMTALHGYADIDIMLVLHYGKHIIGKSPSEVLKDVRDSISTKTDVRRNGQAVTLYYQTGFNVDIVPVFYTYENTASGAEQITHYNVPDMHSETWIKSKPKQHAIAMEKKVLECGANFRRIIRLIKWWNRVHSRYLQSYHIEILAIRVLDGNLNDISWNVFQFFEKARALLAAPLWHDIGYIDAYLSNSDRLEVLKRFDTAITKSRDAWYADSLLNPNQNAKTAIETWRRIFGDKFPTYG
jgi:hypothetical protein